LRKRKNKTIIEAINATMHNHNPYMILWSEACMKQYMNKRLHQNMKNMTLEEVFIGIKPEIEFFRLFGCPVYFHVPKEKKSKIDPLERNDIMNLQRHSRLTSLVRDRLIQTETFPLKKRQSFKDQENIKWRLIVIQYLLPLQEFIGRHTLF
jgi:hypothetical protein